MPKGSFANPSEAATARLNFEDIKFKAFVIVATLAQRICGSSQAVKDAINSLNPSKIAESLKKAKGIFLMHTQASKSETITLDELHLELKSAGTFTPEEEV